MYRPRHYVLYERLRTCVRYGHRRSPTKLQPAPSKPVPVSGNLLRAMLHERWSLFMQLCVVPPMHARTHVYQPWPQAAPPPATFSQLHAVRYSLHTDTFTVGSLAERALTRSPMRRACMQSIEAAPFSCHRQPALPATRHLSPPATYIQPPSEPPGRTCHVALYRTHKPETTNRLHTRAAPCEVHAAYVQAA